MRVQSLLLLSFLAVSCLDTSESSQQTCENSQAKLEPHSEVLDKLLFDNLFVAELPGENASSASMLTLPRQIHGKFWAEAKPEPLPPPVKMIGYSLQAGALLGLDSQAGNDEEFRRFVSGERGLNGSFAYAHCYGGHQFGYWAGQLGDGRVINLGEVLGANRTRWELQIKGAGKTAFSRAGDGRAVLRSSVREFLGSEFMASMNVPTSRALTLTASQTATITRDQFYDGNIKDEPGAMVVRMAPTWIRFGTFELFSNRGDTDSMKKLADFVLANYYPFIAQIAQDQGSCPYTSLLIEVAKRTGRLFARWHAIGFVHGVLNTDNLSILGISIDFGPYAFMDRFNQDFVPNTSDDEGRYSYSNQPKIGAWNLEKLVDAMSPILKGGHFNSPLVTEHYWKAFKTEYRRVMLDKMLLTDGNTTDDDLRINGLLDWMLNTEADYSRTFIGIERLAQRWGSISVLDTQISDSELDEFLVWPAVDDLSEEEVDEIRDWLQAYKKRFLKANICHLVHKGMPCKPRIVPNALYQPRNFLMHEAITAAERGDFSILQSLFECISRPATEMGSSALHEKFSSPAPSWSLKRGISQLSCSS